MQIRNPILFIVATALLIAACGPATPAAPSRATAQPVPLVGTVFTGTGPMLNTPPFALAGQTTVFEFEYAGDDAYRVVLHTPEGDDLILFDGAGKGKSAMTQTASAGEYTFSITASAKWTLTVSEK